MANSTRPQEATAMLRADHKKVSQLFAQYEQARTREHKRTLVDEICTELLVHAQLEEEIFYPAVKAALQDHELIPEGIVEHASIKQLIEHLRDAEPDGEMFDAKVKVMGEFVEHHVKEEQNEMFPKARKSELNMRELGRRLAERKQQLLQR